LLNRSKFILFVSLFSFLVQVNRYYCEPNVSRISNIEADFREEPNSSDLVKSINPDNQNM